MTICDQEKHLTITEVGGRSFSNGKSWRSGI